MLQILQQQNSKKWYQPIEMHLVPYNTIHPPIHAAQVLFISKGCIRIAECKTVNTKSQGRLMQYNGQTATMTRTKIVKNSYANTYCITHTPACYLCYPSRGHLMQCILKNQNQKTERKFKENFSTLEHAVAEMQRQLSTPVARANLLLQENERQR